MKGGRPNKKTVIGTVLSDKADKTITVLWETRKMHPLYKKFVKRHKKLTAHDENNEAGAGDLVKITEARPISKRKAWRLVKVMEKAEQRGSQL